MVLFLSLLIALMVSGIFVSIFLVMGGAAFIAVFGDVIIFGLLVWLIVKLVRKLKNKN